MYPEHQHKITADRQHLTRFPNIAWPRTAGSGSEGTETKENHKQENQELAKRLLCPRPLPFPEPVGALGHGVDYFTAGSAEKVGVKSEHQNRLFYAEHHVFFPISVALVARRRSAELTLIDNDAEHHLGIPFTGFNKQRSAVG